MAEQAHIDAVAGLRDRAIQTGCYAWALIPSQFLLLLQIGKGPVAAVMRTLPGAMPFMLTSGITGTIILKSNGRIFWAIVILFTASIFSLSSSSPRQIRKTDPSISEISRLIK